MASNHSLTIPKKPATNLAPLSLAQQRLWFIYQFDPQSPAYNISRAWRFKGSLHTQALTTSLNLIVARHEALRTTFREIDGQPVQIIEPVRTVTLQDKDFSGYSPDQLDKEIDRFLTDEPRKPFDLLTGPLLRFTLIRCAPDDHVLVFTVHHMVFDGTSLKNFCQELSRCYQATVAEQPNPLTPLPIQYQDVAYWQQEHVTEKTLASQLAFWKQELHEAPLVLEIPSDSMRPKDNSCPGNVQTFTISPQIISKLKELIQPQGVTMFMALLAVFQVLLARYTGKRDLLVGTPIAGRTHTDIEPLMGFFVNTLVLRVQLPEQLTFQDILRQVRKTCLKAYRHQGVPFEKLVEVLKPLRDPSRHPIVQTIFQLRQASDIYLSFPELTAHPFPVKKRTGNFDLHLVCEETASGIQGFLYYPQTLYADDAMARFVKHYQILLETLLTNPERPVRQVPFLTDAECHQQLVEWNDTVTVYPKDASLPTLFEQQVAQRPEAEAVVSGDAQLTYGQLNARANQLAHYLQRYGVGPEVRVGVCLERGLDLIVSLLAILKAGGTYVPLDPSYPADRLSYMVEDAEICLLVTTAALQAKLPACLRQVICVDIDWDRIHQESERNLNSGISPDNVAYVIYTSGSTGHPKGVLVSHYNVIRLFQATHAFMHFDGQDVWTSFHSYAFDFSVWELWGAILHGGQIVVVPYEISRTPKAFYELLCDHRVTILNQTPSAFRQLVEQVEALNLIKPPGLRWVILGGEILDFSSLRPWVSRYGDAYPQVMNMYGITETTVHVTHHWVKSAEINESKGSFIGSPIPDLRVYLLDRHIQLVPHGVLGELYIGGAGITRGYLNQPELTAERFLPDPYTKQPGHRLYKSGDLGRHLPNGQLQYLGRRDGQVKIRGFRIEVGEIETGLTQHPGVHEGVVVCREDEPGVKQLVAYLKLSQKKGEIPELRTYLQGRLPEYMVPGAFVILETFPLTPNGKVDKQALPVPKTADRTRGMIYMAPRTLIEQLLAAIWQEVLGVEQVGVHDNFFELGGHSLLATQVVARLRNVLELDIPLRTLFEHPTVAQLAREIDTQLTNAFPDWPKDGSPTW